MRARQVRTTRPTRFQVSWTLVKEEPRVAILFWFFILAAAAILSFEYVVLFKIVSRPSWPLVNKVVGLLRLAAVADAVVLGSTFWGARHFAAFSWMDRMLTHLAVAIAGILLIGFACYSGLNSPSYRLPNEPALAGAMFAGSLLFFWVFLYYGRKQAAGN